MNSIHLSKYPYIFSSLEVAASFLPVSAVSDPFIEIHFIQNIESGSDTSWTSNLELIVNYFCFVNKQLPWKNAPMTDYSIDWLLPWQTTPLKECSHDRLLYRLTTSLTDYSLDRVLHRLTTSLTEDSLDRLLPWQKFHRQKILLTDFLDRQLPRQTTPLKDYTLDKLLPLTYYSLDILLPWHTTPLT